VSDLIDLYVRVADRAADVAGRAYNVGGGPANTLSLLELLERLHLWAGRPVQPAFAEPRPGDQLVFVADVRRATEDFGWSPSTPLDRGLDELLGWVERNAA
jgi:CDP-paratose 2-epimerase